MGRLIVISLDAVGAEDLLYLETQPEFQKFMKRASVCRNVESVYPSITYPAHSTIVTGKYPRDHGVINNIRIEPHRKKPDWCWQRRFIKGSTVYDEALKKGMKVAALLWPVTARSAITYNMPEVWSTRDWMPQVYVSAVNGSLGYQLKMHKLFGHIMDGVKQPMLDDFVQQSLLCTLREYRPDLTLAHFTDVDGNRHLYGVHHEIITQALKRHDVRLGQILETVRDMGWEEDTNIVILGDHYQMDVHHVLYPNHLFKEKGWLTANKNRIITWNVLAWECDGSCYVYVRHDKDRREVYDALEEWRQSDESAIEKIYTGEEAKAMGADPACAFMLEAKEGYYFQNQWQERMRPVGDGDFRATHGYMPGRKGYETFFMAAGPDVPEKEITEKMKLVQEKAILEKIMGL